MMKRIKTDSVEFNNEEEVDKVISPNTAKKSKKIKRSGQEESESESKDDVEIEKHIEKPEETTKRLEDAEYKDLNQRYKQDERDINYVLNNQEAIEEARKEAEEATIKLNESIEKIEEEQDLVFKEKVALIAKDTIKELKSKNMLGDISKIEGIEEHMIQKVFECFLENKQELLKKIAGKLASQAEEEYDGDGYDEDRGDDGDQLAPENEIQRNSKRSNRTTQKNKGDDIDSDMDENKSYERGNRERGDDGEYMNAMIDRSYDIDEERNNFNDNSEMRSASKEKEYKRKSRRGASKESESQATFLMNIQTTADLISYVKRRQHKLGGFENI